MLGAILGDIIGSRFEFDRGNKTKEFELFTKQNEFTDDSVMTVAIAEGLLKVSKEATEKEIKDSIIKSMVHYGKKYPFAGYGARFIHWFNRPVPYNSYGNGSAMRVSSVGWLYDSLERTIEVARYTAEISHNHPEGIKGACSTATAIYLARTGASKQEIKKYIEENFQYDLSRTCDEIRPGYYHVESCQQSVPEAITAFLEGESYEDVIRNVISLGGDTDTTSAIAGAIAEAYYGIPEQIKKEVNNYIGEDFKKVLDQFSERKINKQ